MSTTESSHTGRTDSPLERRDRTHWLYIAVIVAVGLGIAVGFLFGEDATELKPLGDGFVALIKMMISPIIFCTSCSASGRSGRPHKSARSAGSRWAISW
jgi:aerobic C4-dicarboxylate transport protein